MKKNDVLVLFVKPSEDGASFNRFFKPSYIKGETFEVECENSAEIEKIALLEFQTTKKHLWQPSFWGIVGKKVLILVKSYGL